MPARDRRTTRTRPPASAIDEAGVRPVASAVHPETMHAVRERLPDDKTVQRMAALHLTLADPSRARILCVLAVGELCVGDVAAAVGLSLNAVSHHLMRLRDQGVLGCRKQGRMVYYRLLDADVRRMVADGRAHARERRPSADAA